MFGQYVRCNTFSLNVDVMKTILTGNYILLYNKTKMLKIIAQLFFIIIIYKLLNFLYLYCSSTDIVDNKDGVMKKLDLIQSLPHSRAKRLMNQWSHPVSVMLRAREHAAEILSGMSVRASNYRRNIKYRTNSG